MFIHISFSYVPAAVEISRTASASRNSNTGSHDHRNHASKHSVDNINPAMHQYGVAANNGNPPLNANLGFHDFSEPCLGSGLNGKPSNAQRSHLSHQHHHPSYMPGYESTSAHSLDRNSYHK